MPYIGDLYKKLYLTRITDNMAYYALLRHLGRTLARDNRGSGRQRHLPRILTEAARGGQSRQLDVSGVCQISQGDTCHFGAMLQIGEETGEMGSIWSVFPSFMNARSMLGGHDCRSHRTAAYYRARSCVGFLLASVLLPIYNTTPICKGTRMPRPAARLAYPHHPSCGAQKTSILECVRD